MKMGAKKQAKTGDEHPICLLWGDELEKTVFGGIPSRQKRGISTLKRGQRVSRCCDYLFLVIVKNEFSMVNTPPTRVKWW
jgi:hypothetical protein